MKALTALLAALLLLACQRPPTQPPALPPAGDAGQPPASGGEADAGSPDACPGACANLKKLGGCGWWWPNSCLADCPLTVSSGVVDLGCVTSAVGCADVNACVVL
ncbi:MAG: hypothetical protein L3J73_04880 [Thermoplasmata archaeon]|nr:hypothetical protein [Thermoplasmata archaeon]